MLKNYINCKNKKERKYPSKTDTNSQRSELIASRPEFIRNTE